MRSRDAGWLGHVLRIPNERIPNEWTGRRKRGRLKTSTKTVMRELEEMGLSWGEAQAKAQDRVQWWRTIAVLLRGTGLVMAH